MLALFLLVIVGFGGQAFSLFNWEKAVDLGLQNDRFSGDAVERTLAKIEKGRRRHLQLKLEVDKGLLNRVLLH